MSHPRRLAALYNRHLLGIVQLIVAQLVLCIFMVPNLSPCRTIQKDADDDEEEEIVPLCLHGANIAMLTLIPGTKRRQVNFTPRLFYPRDRAYRRFRQPLTANAQTPVQCIR